MYVSMKQAAKETSLSKTTLYKLAKQGRLTLHKVGSRTCICADQLRTLFGGDAHEA